jgi:hypothetical protein
MTTAYLVECGTCGRHVDVDTVYVLNGPGADIITCADCEEAQEERRWVRAMHDRLRSKEER